MIFDNKTKVPEKKLAEYYNALTHSKRKELIEIGKKRALNRIEGEVNNGKYNINLDVSVLFESGRDPEMIEEIVNFLKDNGFTIGWSKDADYFRGSIEVSWKDIPDRIEPLPEEENILIDILHKHKQEMEND